MSATAVSSTLNPNAPLFIPAALLQVEDYSPQWWDLVTTTAWFSDHWSREHSYLDDMAKVLDGAALLPDDDDDAHFVVDDDLFVVDDDSLAARLGPPPTLVLKTDPVLEALNLTSPNGAPRAFHEKPRHVEKPAKHAASPKSGAPRMIHQPR